MVTTSTWVLLAYRIPREPSTPRIAVWRQLKRLGVAQIGDGLVGLPYDAATKEALEWVAHAVFEADGQATIWLATPTARRFGVGLAEQLTTERAGEYSEILRRLADLEQTVPSARALTSIRSELRRIERRDYFPPPERSQARAALKEIEARLGKVATT